MTEAEHHQQQLEQLQRAEWELARAVQDYANLAGLKDTLRLLNDITDRMTAIQVRAALNNGEALNLRIDTQVRQ